MKSIDIFNKILLLIHYTNLKVLLFVAFFEIILSKPPQLIHYHHCVKVCQSFPLISIKITKFITILINTNEVYYLIKF